MQRLVAELSALMPLTTADLLEDGPVSVVPMRYRSCCCNHPLKQPRSLQSQLPRPPKPQ